MTKRENSRRRRAARFESRPLILVVCGGVKTEEQYFKGLRGHYRNLAAKVYFETDGVDPATLVRKASTYRERHPRDYDEVWCVVDVDHYDIESAWRLAREKGIRLAVSNPCFEYWLLLHFADHDRKLADASEVNRHLRRHLPDYDKARLAFADFVAGLESAKARACARCDHGREHRSNPSSGVWKLVEAVVPPERAQLS